MAELFAAMAELFAAMVEELIDCPHCGQRASTIKPSCMYCGNRLPSRHIMR
jgi:DNA-directed RNA polymerase subunit RPC12/RpoP